MIVLDDWLARWWAGKHWFVLEHPLPSKVDYFFFHTYGPKNKHQLVSPTIDVLKNGASDFSFLSRTRGKSPDVKILMTAVEYSPGYFWPGCWQQEIDLKLALVNQNGIKEDRIIVLKEGIQDTIQEIERVRDFLNWEPVTIMVFGDRYHLPRIAWLWEEIYPEATVILRNVTCRWKWREMSSKYQKAELIWLMANWWHLKKLKKDGIKKAGKIRHRVKMKK